MVQYDYIRFLYFNQKKSKRAIAKMMGVHRNTVTKAINNPEQNYTLSRGREKPVNGSFQDRIEAIIKDNCKQPKNLKLTKTRIYELLCEEGYQGSYSSFTYQARQIEESIGINEKEGFLKLVHIKGSMQVDFGEDYVMQKGIPKKIYFFAAKLCYSKPEFVKAYPLQKTEFFFDGLVSAFAFFGGVPKKIIFDNLKAAVKTILIENQRELQEEFIKFKAFYCFESEFCAPFKANEKGLIENFIKYIKNNYLLPRLEFNGYDSFNEYLLNKCIARLEKGKFQGEAWTKRLLEEDFLPLKERYQYARIKEVKVDTYQLIHLERNRYSVPTRYIGKKVQANIYPFKISVTYKGEVITEHERLFGRDKEHLDPYHFLSLLKKKARAYDQAKVIQDWQLPDIYDLYHKRLQAHRQSNSKGTREFIDILKLTEEYTVRTISKVLKVLDEKNLYGYQNVLSQLRYQTQCTSGTNRLATVQLKSFQLDHIRTTHLPLEAYNNLMKEGGEKAI